MDSSEHYWQVKFPYNRIRGIPLITMLQTHSSIICRLHFHITRQNLPCEKIRNIVNSTMVWNHFWRSIIICLLINYINLSNPFPMLTSKKSAQHELPTVEKCASTFQLWSVTQRVRCVQFYPVIRFNVKTINYY